MKKIVSLMVKTLAERCNKQMGIVLRVTGAAKGYIVDTAYEPKYGARPLRRMIQNKIEDSLAEEILSGKIKAGDMVEAGLHKNEIAFSIKKEK